MVEEEVGIVVYKFWILLSLGSFSSRMNVGEAIFKRMELVSYFLKVCTSYDLLNL